MRLIIDFLIIVVLFAGAAGVARSQTTTAIAQTAGIVTLYALDPLTQSFCLRDGGSGLFIQKGQVFNRCSDINFSAYSANGFSVGVEGGRTGVILDLGTPVELSSRHGYTETVGKGQGFASLNVRNGKVMIVRDFKEGTRQELKESAQLFDVPKSSASSAVKLGHIYLIRITDGHDKSYEMIAKLMVIAHVPNESVTFRWQVISDSYAKL